MSARPSFRRVRFLGAALAVLGLAPVAVADVSTVPRSGVDRVPGLVTVSTSTDGGRSPSVSGDGRFVAHVAASGDDRGATVVLRDRELAVANDMLPWSSTESAGASAAPVLSDDGCTLTVVTELPLDRFLDDNDGYRWDVYQRRLGHCEGTDDWTLVSALSDGTASGAADPTVAPAVSADGSKVAFSRRFDYLERVALPDDLPLDATTVEVVDLDLSDDNPARSFTVNDDGEVLVASEPTLSDDGTLLAATVSAIDGTSRAVWVWSLSDADRDSSGRRVGGASESWQPSFSGDGKRLAFVSESTSLVPDAVLLPCTLRCVPQVYVLDRASGEVLLGSRAGRGPEVYGGNGPSSRPVLDRTGSIVVYVTRATNLFPLRHRSVGGADDGEVVRHLLGTARVERVSLDADGMTPTPAVHGSPAMSATGRVVVFDSAAPPVETGGIGRRVSISSADLGLRLSGVDMGEAAVGFPSIERVLTLTNRGPAMFVPTVVELDGVDFTITSGTCVQLPPVPVPPGGTCTVGVTFFPGTPGARSVTLTVREEGFGAASVSASITGVGGEPRLRVEPVLLEAGTTVVGQNGAFDTFFVQSVTGRTTRIESVVLGGESPADFVLFGDECSGERVSPGEVCRLVVVFRPTAAGRRRATIVITSSNGGRTAVTLVGEGRYSPTMTLTGGSLGLVDGRHRVASPSRIRLTGKGFPPDREITVRWGDGFGRPVRVITDAAGSFTVAMVVFPGERLGRRSLVAVAPGLTATVGVLVVAGPR